MRQFNLALIVIFLNWAVLPTAALAASKSPLDHSGISPEQFLSPDGTLNLPANFSGAFDLTGWDVRLDSFKGPVFAPLNLNAGEWVALGSGASGNGSLNNTVLALAAIGGDLYVGGSFTNVNNDGTILTAADRIAKWDGNDWSALGSNGAGGGSIANNQVNALAVIGTNLYVGGTFQNINNNGTVLGAADRIAMWDGTNWSALSSNGAGNGAIGNNSVFALAVMGSDLYVGGNFSNVSNNGTVLTAADRIAKWDGTNWAALSSNGAGEGAIGNNNVLALVVQGTNLYVGGNFQNVNDNGTSLTAADRIARWDGTNWSALGSNGAGNGAIGNNSVFALAVMGSDLYVAGNFSNVSNNGTVLTAADRIAKWDGANWAALSSNGAGEGAIGNNNVLALVVQGTNLYVGGNFQNVNDNGTSLTAADRIARWDGTNWAALGSNGAGDGSITSGQVNALTDIGTDLYLGGTFSNVNDNGTVLAAADFVVQTGAGSPAYSATPPDGATLAFIGPTGSTPSLDISVTNSGGADSELDVSLTSISPGYTVASGLPIDDLHTTDLAATITVECDSAPQIAGTLVLATNDPANTSVTYDLTCTAADPTYSAIPPDGSTLAFSGITGSNPSLVIEVSNIGDPGSDLDVSLNSISAGYSISGLPIIGLDPSDATITITVECDSVPQANGTLTLDTNDQANPTVTYSLTCTAVDPAYGGNPADGATLAFSGITGSNPSLVIEVSNIGDAGSDLDVSLNSISAGYSIASGLPIIGLDPSDAAITITVECDSVPQANGTLTLDTNDQANPTVTYSLTCTAVDPTYSAIPPDGSTLAFTGIIDSTPPSLTVDVSNSGDPGSQLDVSLNSISSGYSIVSGLQINDQETTDPPSTITVQCNTVPQANGILELSTNDAANPNVTYLLTCAVDRGSKCSGEISSSGTSVLSCGRIWVSVPASAIPAGETNCSIAIKIVGESGDYGFSLDDTVWDVKIVCDSGEINIFFAPITVCIRPVDGLVSNKSVFSRHSGGSFASIAGGNGPNGYVCGSTQALSLFTLGEFALPGTGFAPGTITRLDEQPANEPYFEYDALILEMPSLDLMLQIWGVPLSQNGWDVSWLGENAGYLYGTAFPTWVGNSVLTAHVWNADNSPGPFYQLRDLRHGDQFFIQSNGLTYVYEVRSNRLVSESNLDVMKPSDYSLITLITCESFDEGSGGYLYRRAVQAVLVEVR